MDCVICYERQGTLRHCASSIICDVCFANEKVNFRCPLCRAILDPVHELEELMTYYTLVHIRKSFLLFPECNAWFHPTKRALDYIQKKGKRPLMDACARLMISRSDGFSAGTTFKQGIYEIFVHLCICQNNWEAKPRFKRESKISLRFIYESVSIWMGEVTL